MGLERNDQDIIKEGLSILLAFLVILVCRVRLPQCNKNTAWLLRFSTGFVCYCTLSTITNTTDQIRSNLIRSDQETELLGKETSMLMSRLNSLQHSKFFFQISQQCCFVYLGEKSLRKLIDSAKSPTGEHWNVDDIKNIVTAKHLCSCRDPITMAFEVPTVTIILISIWLKYSQRNASSSPSIRVLKGSRGRW